MWSTPNSGADGCRGRCRRARCGVLGRASAGPRAAGRRVGLHRHLRGTAATTQCADQTRSRTRAVGGGPSPAPARAHRPRRAVRGRGRSAASVTKMTMRGMSALGFIAVIVVRRAGDSFGSQAADLVPCAPSPQRDAKRTLRRRSATGGRRPKADTHCRNRACGRRTESANQTPRCSRCSCRKPLTDYAYSLWGRTPRVCADTSARPYDGLRCRWSG